MVALLPCVVWLLGVELLPNLHLGTHDDDHTHTPSGMVVTVTFATPDGGEDHATKHDRGVAHDHATVAGSKRQKRTRATQLAIDVAPVGHSATGLAHHALALHAPAPPAYASSAARPIVWELAATPSSRPSEVSVARPQARGPPTA